MDLVVYHIAPDIRNVQKYGLCSPQSLYDKDRKLFHETSFRVYENRTKRWSKKSYVKDEDILDFLNSDERAPFTSRSIFFSFIPCKNIPHIELGNRYEFVISVDTLRKYSTGNPVVVLSRNKEQVSWDTFEKDFNNYIKQALQGTKKIVTDGLQYKYILHLAVDCDPIPFSKMILNYNEPKKIIAEEHRRHMTTSVPFFADPCVSFLVTSDMSSTEKEHYLNEVEWHRLDSQMEHHLSLFELCIANEAGDPQYLGHPNGMVSEGMSLKQWFKDAFELVRRVTHRVYKLGRLLVEKITKRYELIMKLWDSKLSKRLDEIIDEKFENTTVKCISIDDMKKRIEVISTIANIIENIQHIVSAPIQDPEDEDAYMTKDFAECYKAVQEIGLNIKNKTFVTSKSESYKNAESKTTIQQLGYSKGVLPELIKLAKNIAKFGTSKWVKATTALFQKIHVELTNREKEIIGSKMLDEVQKKAELKKVQIRISRLWWISNCIHLLNELAGDCLEYTLTIFRAADNAIPLNTNHRADEVGGNKYIF